MNRRRDEIRRSVNDLLYDGVKFSSAGSVLAALVVVAIFGPVVGYTPAVGWFVMVTVVYALRTLDLLAYRRYRARVGVCERGREWRRRVSLGALAASAGWSSCLWIIYPPDDPAYEALLILMLGGVCGGALATLPYDRKLSNAFQLIILVAVQVRLWTDAAQYTIELAIFSLFVFGFLITCGQEVAKNYYEQLSLRYDSQETNITLMKTTEEMARLGYWQWPVGTDTVELSDRLAVSLGFVDKHVSFTRCYRRIHPDDHDRVRQGIAKAGALEKEVSFEYRMRPRGANAGEYRHMKQVVKPVVDSHGATILLGTVQDVSDVKQAAERIYRMAYFDELTSLENRARFHEHLQHHVHVAEHRKQAFAVIYIDLDDFKGINESLGHEYADQYLRALASHLAGSVRKSDFVARMGGDEFALLVNDLGDDDVVDSTLRRILDFTRHTIAIGPHRIQPRMSAGVALFPRDATTPDRLLSCATIAVENIKPSPKTASAYYTPEMEQTRLERVRLEADLRYALEQDQFELWYQPKISLTENRMTGAEALIRWRHPDKGLISPNLFIDTAERVGMISDIGDWVLRTACRQQAEWRAQGHSFCVSINISGEHFTRPGFAAGVAAVLERHGLDGGALEIEITESVSRDPEEHGRVCHELRKAGVRISIDDFGTGYSSLSVLGDFEIDTIKIDRSFVTGLPDRATSRLMVKTIVNLSAGLGYDIIAEGVETLDQLEFLREAGCLDIQGYYFSRPVQACEIPRLAAGKWMAVQRRVA